jgi:hypothetical protein
MKMITPNKYVFLAIVISISLIWSFYAGKWVANTAWEKTYADHLLLDSQANEKATATALTNQKTYQVKLKEVQDYAKSLETTITADTVVNDVANDGVQQQFDRIKTLHQISTGATIAERAAAATDRIVLAELLSWTHEAYRRTAIQADENRKAGLICEAEYNALVKVCE